MASPVRWMRAQWRHGYGDPMTPRNLLLIALFAGIVLALGGAFWGISAAGDGSPVPGGSIGMAWGGIALVVIGLVGRAIVKKS